MLPTPFSTMSKFSEEEATDLQTVQIESPLVKVSKPKLVVLQERTAVFKRKRLILRNQFGDQQVVIVNKEGKVNEVVLNPKQ